MGVLAVDVMEGIRSRPNLVLEDLHRGAKFVGPASEPEREHVEVAEPLLDRVAVIADLLDAGANVEPEQIAKGIELWETYLHGTHWARLSRLADPPASDCATAIREVRENHERAPQRMAHLRTLLEAYSAGLPNARGSLVLGLRSDVLVDRAWACFRERHPFSYPSDRLSPAANERVGHAPAQNLQETKTLEEEVQNYLALPVASRSEVLETRCSAASCASKATVPWASAPRQEVRISQPGNDWGMRAVDPVGTGSAFTSGLWESLPSPAVDAIRGIVSLPHEAMEELHREHAVAERLLERLMEFGERIKSGERVDAKTVRFGVGLLEAYVHRVHAFQMEDRELRPEAQGVAALTLVDHLDRMGTNHEGMSRRTQELLHLIGRWASGDESCRAAIGDGLIDIA